MVSNVYEPPWCPTKNMIITQLSDLTTEATEDHTTLSLLSTQSLHPHLISQEHLV
jgi:hypothetical protein